MSQELFIIVNLIITLSFRKMPQTFSLLNVNPGKYSFLKECISVSPSMYIQDNLVILNPFVI